MRILHLAHDLAWGGVQRYLVDTLPELKRRHHAVMLVLVTGGGPLMEPLMESGVLVRAVPLLTRWRGWTWTRGAGWAELTATARQFGPDVIHTHLAWGHAAGVWLQRSLSPRPVWVATLHGRMDRPLHRWLTGRARPGVALWHCVSDVVPPPGGVAWVRIPPGIPAAVGDAHRRPEPTVGVVSRLVADKRVDLVVRAVPHLPPDFRVAVVGDGPAAATWKTLARRLGVADRVSWLGAVDARTVYPTWHALAAPSASEGFGMAVGEALRYGLPVVASAIPAHASWRDAHPDRIRLAPPDPAAWATALWQTLARVPAAQPVSNLPTPAQHAARLESVYRALWHRPAPCP